MKTNETVLVADASGRLNPELRIRIQGIDGSVSTFTQDEPALVQRTLRESQRRDFFAQDRIIIAGESSVTTFIVSKIARIDLAGEGVAAWKPKAETPDLVEIPQEEFLTKGSWQGLENVERGKPHHAAGQSFVGFIEVCFVGDRRVYLKFQGLAALPAERLRRIHSFLALPSLSFRLSDGGGLGIINLRNAAKFTAYPGPAEVPSDVWIANETLVP